MMGTRFWVGVFSFVLLVGVGLPCLSKLTDHRHSLPDFGKLDTAEVVRVVDGDTVMLRFGDKAEERCRLVDVDTPAAVGWVVTQHS